MTDILPTIVYPSTLADQKSRLLAAAIGTDNSVKVCAAIDATTRVNWGLFYASIVAFFNEDAGIWGWGQRYDRGQEYESELANWQALLATSGCKLSVPKLDPVPPLNLMKLVQYAVWGAGFVAVAYTVGKVVSVVPKPARRSAPDEIPVVTQTFGQHAQILGRHVRRLHKHARRLLSA